MRGILNFDRVYFHYNILRLLEDPVDEAVYLINALLHFTLTTEVVFIVAPTSVIFERARTRLSVENGGGNYKNHFTTRISSQLIDSDLSGLYSILFELTQTVTDLKVTVFESKLGDFVKVIPPSINAVKEILLPLKPGLNKREIQAMIANVTFEYHQVELPYGLIVGGPYSHIATRNIIANRVGNVSGLRVLDVGCAIGFMTFEFAKMEAKLVRGVEIRRERLSQAVLLNKIFRFRNVEFIHLSLQAWPHGSWDIVSCLNVIHHVDQPVRFLHDLVHASRKLLILEVAEVQDQSLPTSSQLIQLRQAVGNNTFAIAVSLPAPDTPFMLSSAFIESILVHQMSACPGGLEILPSPIAGRRLLFCSRA